MIEQHPYGYCPKCGAPGVMRERIDDGNDRCARNCTYPSRDACATPDEAPKSSTKCSNCNQMAARLEQVEHDLQVLRREREQHHNWSSGIASLIQDAARKLGIDTMRTEAYYQITEISKQLDVLIANQKEQHDDAR